MAATSTTVGSAFLSAPIQTMIDKLTSKDFQDYANNNKLSLSLVTQLQTALLTLAPVLDDAEKKQIHCPGIRKWLDELKDAIFDAEDLLNQISYDSLRCKVRNPGWNFLSSLFNTSEDFNSQLKTACERLQLFAQQIDNLGLQTVSHKVLPTAYRRSTTISSVNESFIVGRVDDKEKLINMLLSERDNDKNNLEVVAIAGMGGLGKTTLAKLVYNYLKVENHFDLKAWASVSLDFDILEITRSLLKTVTLGNWDTNDLHILRAELKKNLRGKRFLFVLDDVWNEVYDDWIDLVSPFVGKSGSKVIITTRSHSVAMMTGASHIYLLGGLSREDSWSLLLKDVFAFGGSVDPMLEYIGQSIARKCGGLPLALKALAGLLRTNLDAEYWDAILNSDIWELPTNDVMPALHVSYQYLPSHLKRCFTYCSIFPKDYPLDRKQLVLLWMAEGLVEKSLDSKEAEKICDEFFDELISRSLIQQSNDDTEEEKIFMHDFIRDLATYVAGTSCCRLEYGTKISKNVRHLSYNREKLDISMNCEIFHDFKCLRTFLPVGPLWGQNCLPRQVLDDFLPTLIRLRVLSLSKYKDIKKLPDSLGNLTQLRYLDLSNTGIKSLPDTICNLYNLQTLILSNCCHLIGLPSHIGMLINLRHLDISGTKIREMPMQITKLEKLQTLTVFIVGKSQVGLSIKELRKFQYLQGKLTILNLHNVIDSMEAFAANIKSKQQIEELVLQWGEQTECCEVQLAVLDMLQPSITLKKLSINYYGGKIFPSWLGDSSFSYMVYLSISDCEYCRTLPPLGQLSSLKHLRIDGMKTLKTIGPEFYGMVGEGSRSSFQPFPSLQNLQFRNMSSWKEWLPFEGGKFPFPCLQTLRLQKCPELKGHLPNHPPSIQEIVIIDCGRLLETPSTLHCLSSLENKNIVYLK
ncbi:unnamed protein product [Lathyrus sativus]|nr:unnamed protein product [Lathyrus sativus]